MKNIMRRLGKAILGLKMKVLLDLQKPERSRTRLKSEYRDIDKLQKRRKQIYHWLMFLVILKTMGVMKDV